MLFGLNNTNIKRSIQAQSGVSGTRAYCTVQYTVYSSVYTEESNVWLEPVFVCREE